MLGRPSGLPGLRSAVKRT